MTCPIENTMLAAENAKRMREKYCSRNKHKIITKGTEMYCEFCGLVLGYSKSNLAKRSTFTGRYTGNQGQI